MRFPPEAARRSVPGGRRSATKGGVSFSPFMLWRWTLRAFDVDRTRWSSRAQLGLISLHRETAPYHRAAELSWTLLFERRQTSSCSQLLHAATVGSVSRPVCQPGSL